MRLIKFLKVYFLEKNYHGNRYLRSSAWVIAGFQYTGRKETNPNVL